MAHLESVARGFGNEAITLTSTETARRFYRSAGYADSGAPVPSFGNKAAYPMAKRL